MHEYAKVYHHKFNKQAIKHSILLILFWFYVDLFILFPKLVNYVLGPKQSFKKFTFLVVFKLRQILGCYTS